MVNTYPKILFSSSFSPLVNSSGKSSIIAFYFSLDIVYDWLTSTSYSSPPGVCWICWRVGPNVVSGTMLAPPLAGVLAYSSGTSFCLLLVKVSCNIPTRLLVLAFLLLFLTYYVGLNYGVGWSDTGAASGYLCSIAAFC